MGVRGYVRDQNEFVEIKDLLSNESGELNYYVCSRENDEDLLICNADRVTLTPYTGYNSRSGKQIFTGDIVKVSGMYNHFAIVVCKDISYRKLMEWKKNNPDEELPYTCWLVRIDIGDDEPIELTNGESNYIEVVGNIFNDTDGIPNDLKELFI